jgi:hypothetical protein
MKRVQRILSALPEEECAGQRHARILTGRRICNIPHDNRAGPAFAGSPMDRFPTIRIAPQAARMVVHVVIGLDLLATVKARGRAGEALSKEEMALLTTLIRFTQTFEAPHIRFQERRNYATAIARRKPIGAGQTRELRGRASSFSE